MKKFYFAICFLILLAVSCSKDCQLSNDQSTNHVPGNADLKCAGLVIQVSPNGTDDTKALIDAFARAKAIGKKAAIKLMPGTFKIRMIEVREFNGTLSGSGKGRTIITNLPDLTPDSVVALNKIPALIAFIGGDVAVSDLTVTMPAALPWLGSQKFKMLLFSDYSADFMPATQHIQVNLNNIEVKGVLLKDNDSWPGVPILDIPYDKFYGVEFGPDMLQKIGNTLITRSNIDATVSNSKFSNFDRGMCAIGCKSGNFGFGTKGGNIFTQNFHGLDVNENIGVSVKVLNNEFAIPEWYYDGLDLNCNEYGTFEYVEVECGTYEVRNNIFNNFNLAIGMMDDWRYNHPENPQWMHVLCENNTFNDLADWQSTLIAYAVKDLVFSHNKIIGEFPGGNIKNIGLFWIDPSDPNSWTEGCKFLNNLFLQKDFTIYLATDSKDNLILGDLSNVTIVDEGVKNNVLMNKNPGHWNPKFDKDHMDRMDRMDRMIDRYKNDHSRH